MRTNDGVYGGAFADGALPIDVDLIDRVEIIRGPGSSLYGTGAFSGVINIIPKRGRDVNGVELAAEYGSWDSERGRVSAGKKTESGLDGLVSVSAFKTRGTPSVVFPELAGDATRNYGVVENNQALRWRNIYTALEYKDFRLEYAEAARRNHLSTGLYGAVFNAPNINSDSTQLLNLEFNHAFNSNDSVFARLGYHYYDYYSDSLYDYPPPTLTH